MKKILHSKFLIVLVMAVGLAGCSFKTVYNQLDWLMLGMVEDFVTLHEAQEQDVKNRINRLLAWHRTEQIPLYVQDLQFIKRATSAGLDEESTEQTFALFMQRWETLKLRVATDLAETLAEVDDKQKAEIYAEIDKRNKDIRKEYDGLSDEQRQDRIAARTIENFERWLGDLNKRQIKIVRGQAAEILPIHEERLAFRHSWQQSFRTILDSELDKQARIGQLTELFVKPEIWQSQAYKDKLAHNSAQVRKLVLDIDRTLNSKQKAHLRERLDHFIGLLQDIAAGK